MNIRVGQGFDVHAFDDEIQERAMLRLGGVDVPYHKTLKAHSDGDVVLHSVCDALLGAIGAGDIGQHFPDTDASFQNTDSTWFVRQVYQQLQAQKYSVVNLDVTIIAQAPKLADYKNKMQQVIAGLLEVSADRVNVKATTTEKLGFCGRSEGIACQCVVLIDR